MTFVFAFCLFWHSHFTKKVECVYCTCFLVKRLLKSLQKSLDCNIALSMGGAMCKVDVWSSNPSGSRSEIEKPVFRTNEYFLCVITKMASVSTSIIFLTIRKYLYSRLRGIITLCRLFFILVKNYLRSGRVRFCQDLQMGSWISWNSFIRYLRHLFLYEE